MTRRSLQTLIGSCVGAAILLSVSSVVLAAAQVVKDTTPPTDVEKLTAVIGDGMVSLSWDAAKDDTGVTGYKVYVGPDEVTDTNTAKYAENKQIENVTTYDVKNLENGKVYYMAVTALDAAGNESESYSPYVTVKPFSKIVAAVNGVDTNTTTTSVATDTKVEDVVAAATPSGADTTAPTVKSAEALYKGQVKVTFSEPVKLPFVKPDKAFTVQDNIIYEKLAVKNAYMDPNDKTGTVVLVDTDNQNPDSDYIVTVTSDVEDLAGNPISSGTSDVGQFKGSALTLDAYLKAHPAAPVQSDVITTTDNQEILKIGKLEVQNDTTLKITFTKPIVLNTDPTKNFTITKKGDDTAKLSLSSIKIDDTKMSTLITATMEPKVNYTLTMSGILDDKGVAMTKENSTFDFVSEMAAVKKDTTPPEDVTNFIAKTVKTMTAKLSWTKSKNSAGDLLEYIIYRSLDGKKYGQMTSLSKDNTAFEAQELEPGYHYYKITAKDGSGNESKGKTVKIRLAETGPEVGLLALMSIGFGRVFGRKKQKKSKV